MGATVEVTALGFVVVDDFGPEGRRPVMGNDPIGTLMFSSRAFAEKYARARDAHREHFEEHGYACGNDPANITRLWDLRDECKRIARTHARTYEVDNAA